MTRMHQALIGAALALAASGAALADSAGVVSAGAFPQRDGASLYGAICQGCHMPDGRGAIGAGAYPALAGNKNLRSGGYVISIVVNAQKAMPGFGGFLDDAQVAAVANYVRTHFGNDYQDAVAPADVKDVRIPSLEYFSLD